MEFGQLPSCRRGFQKATTNRSIRCDITLQSQETQRDVTNSVRKKNRAISNF